MYFHRRRSRAVCLWPVIGPGFQRRLACDRELGEVDGCRRALTEMLGAAATREEVLIVLDSIRKPRLPSGPQVI